STAPAAPSIYTLSLHDALPIFYLVWQTTWQRLTAAKSTKVGISAVVIGFIISGIVGLLAIFIGIAAYQMFEDGTAPDTIYTSFRSEEHTSELQSRFDLVCRLLL